MRKPTQALVKSLTLKFEITRMHEIFNSTVRLKNTLYICITSILIFLTMKSRLLLVLSFPFALSAQQTITSTQNGAASNPLTWDCLCFPGTDDNVIINHTVTMDVNWAITASGSITVNASGALLQAGLKNLLVDGAGSEYINHGNSTFDQIAFINGGTLDNDGHFSITQAAYVGTNSFLTNAGLLDGLDSLMTEGSFVNTGTVYTGNFLNTGYATTSGPIGADSLGNTGSFALTGGYIMCDAFGNSGIFDMSVTGFMEVQQNWFNIGVFGLGAGNEILAHADFYNGDSLGGIATLTNNGSIEIWNNFYNGYEVFGSGHFCVANETYNAGDMNGTYDFCDNTGGAIDFNVGTVGAGITFCQPGCSVGLTEFGTVNVQVYPNPSEGIFSVNGVADHTEVAIYSLAGQLLAQTELLNNSFDVSQLPIGTYLLIFADSNNLKPVKINIQK